MTNPEETSKNNPSLYKTLRNRIVEIQPSTPAKTTEEPQTSIMSSSDSPPPPPRKELDSLESPSTTPPPRRSSRLAAIQKPLYSGRRPARQTGSGESPDKGNKSEELDDDDSRVLDSKKPIYSLSGPVEETSTPKARRTLKPVMVDLISSEDVMEEGMRKLDIDLNLPAKELEAEVKDKGGFLNLRSGARIIRKKMEGTGVASGGFGSDVVQLPLHQLLAEGTDGEGQVRESVGVENFEKDQGESSGANGGKRYSTEEKGKGTLIKDAPVELDLFPVTERLMKDAVSGLSQQYEKGKVESLVREYKWNALDYRKERIKKTRQIKKERRSDRTESFRRAARENASRFAHFRPEEENQPVPNLPERQMPPVQTSQELEDWPGPFSTAIKIIKERNMKQSIIRPGNSSSGSSELAPEIEWEPAKDWEVRSPNRRRPPADSLQSLCLRILAKNADKIASLEYVPDSLKHKLTRLVCDSRKMSNDYMGLLFCGSPTEIRVNDCSSITEEELSCMIQGCKTENLMVLQLDYCGRCLPNYVLRTMVPQSPNGLHALTTISLKGACRLSDVGLKALVASAPALMSINLEMCSFVTSDSINILGDSLGSSLRKLYIDDCQNVDAVKTLPALKKLTHLEVLSVSRVRNVCDDFVSQLVAVHGPNMKELCFSGCRELTDASLKVTAETCSKLCCLDVGNLNKLTDRALGYIAYGCLSIQTLNLYRNAFSDEAIAAFVEASGESLTELWLNNVNEVSYHTAISLARSSRKLRKLDLSFCRKLTDKALGLIVDRCSELKLLKLFGCTQIGGMFLFGHSNPHVEIVGLPFTSIYKHLNYLDTL